MLGDPKKLRTRGSYGYLVSWKDRLSTNSSQHASDLVLRLLADPANVDALRAGLGRPDASLEELEAWLVSGLASGTFSLLRTRRATPTLRTPRSQDLHDLIDDETVPRGTPPPPVEERSYVSVELVDDRGQRPCSGELHFSVNARFSTHPASERVHDRQLPPGSRIGAGYLNLDFHAAAPPDDAIPPQPLGPDALPPDFVSFEVVTEDGKPLPAGYRLHHDDVDVASGQGTEGHARTRASGAPLALTLELDR